MSEKTLITESLLKLLGFALRYEGFGRKIYHNTYDEMVLVFGEANFPILKRRIPAYEGTDKEYEYIGGYEYFEDAKAAYEEEFIPKMLADAEIDLSKFKESLKEYVQSVVDGESREDDSHYIYEDALKAFYGEDIFDTLNRYF